MKKYLSRLMAALLILVLLIAPASALTVDQALSILESWYYYDIPDAAYGAGTVEELIGILGDPYTRYMTPEQYQAFLDSLEGNSSVVGIGVSVRYGDDGLLIVETISGGSAREAGLLPGDLIVEVDGVSTVPGDAAAAELISGREGTSVSVTVLREGERIAYTLARRPVVIPNTEIQILDGGVGYIDCNSFGENTGKDFAELVQRYDGRVNVWVVDLRDNGGGYAGAAIDMINALCAPGRYVYFEYGDGTVEAAGGAQRPDTAKPVIVLTDFSSASASEIVSGNIRDLERGVNVGGRTYGKGVAQVMLDNSLLPGFFEDGDGLKLTVYRFYTAGGTTTDRVGVIPTLLVDDDWTAAVALALCGREEDAALRLRIGASGNCYIAADTDKAVLSALFAALPPQAEVSCLDGGQFVGCTVSQAADRLGVAYTSRWFDDAADSEYAGAINALGTYGLLQGVGGGRFDPKSGLTRAELCVMLARVLDVAYHGPTLFPDVDQDSWYGPSVNALAYLGLVNGTGEGKFSPGDPISQEQYFTILGRTARFINLNLDSYSRWIDETGGEFTPGQTQALAPCSGWARNSVAVLAWGLEEALDGSGDLLYAPVDTLSPQAPILREEAAAGIYAVLSGLKILP